MITDDRLSGRANKAHADIGVNKNHIKIIKKAMAAVTNSQWGTAYRARIMVPGMGMGGKTGTSQVRRISHTERD